MFFLWFIYVLVSGRLYYVKFLNEQLSYT